MISDAMTIHSALEITFVYLIFHPLKTLLTVELTVYSSITITKTKLNFLPEKIIIRFYFLINFLLRQKKFLSFKTLNQRRLSPHIKK